MSEALQSTWNRLTAPHPALQTQEEQRSARLAASMVAALIGLTLTGIGAFYLVDFDYALNELSVLFAGVVVAYFVAYFYTRSPNYRVGVFLVIGLIVTCAVGTPHFLGLNPYVVSGLGMAPMLAAVFLSLRSVVGLSILSIVLAIIATMNIDDVAIFSGIIMSGQAVILVVFIVFRNILEGLRRGELEEAVTAAEQSASAAEAARLAIEKASEERLALQRDIKRLSSPVIPLMDGILLMPLIGTLDSQRAQDIMRSLLQGISQHRAQVVLLDITGVPVMDTAVAKYLNHTILAAQLKGARCIITGMSDTVAETIVNLGINWNNVETLRDLQSGLTAALPHTGFQLVAQGDDTAESLLRSISRNNNQTH